MKFGVTLLATVVLGSGADAFTASTSRTSRVSKVSLSEKIADELSLPCEDECALKSFPNLPESVHPGVVTGQAMVDLLNHAKENGKVFVTDCKGICRLAIYFFLVHRIEMATTFT